MYSLFKTTGKWIMLALLLALANGSQAQSVTVLKKVLDGSKNQLSQDSVVTVQDSIYFNPALQSKLDTPYQVRNVITFFINEYSNLYLPAKFNATVNVRITYTKPDLTIDSVDKSLTLNYDATQAYTSRNSFVFNNAHRVKVKVLSTTVTSSIDVLPALMIENEMDVHPVYKLSCTDDAVKTISSNNPPNTDSTDEISINWPVTIGADEYDLEWAYADSSALLNNVYGNPLNANLLFLNNATRVTVTDNAYTVPLLYDNGGKLFFRVRAVQQKPGYGRMETAWSSDYEGGLGNYSFCGHQRNLNWQSTISFAEEGKRKVVVQYYDGSLRSRQTVTKDNTTNTTIVGESFYDHQGRSVIQVMPAPTLNTIIKYSRNFNAALNGAEYDKDNYDQLVSPADFLTASAKPMSSSTGTNQYYSANNPDKNNGISQFIPDAQGYAFTETEYTQDNTGRISRQSGVGPVYKLGSNHETRYFYANATQEELDALFGTEVGNERHYFKNMVQDANGQFVVNYLDMDGRTIATALAGSPDSAALTDLPSNVYIDAIDTLSREGSNVVKELTLESKQSKLVPVGGDYTFKYSLTPPVLQKKDCDNNTICYNGLYDLEITITDDAYNQRLPGGQPFTKIVRNFTPENIVVNCDAPQPFLVNFTVNLPRGSYEITKRLTLSKQGMDFYRDSVFMKENSCTTLEQFIQQQRDLQLNINCVPTCQSCKDSVGTWSTFRNSYMTRAGIAVTDSAGYRGEALTAYQAASEACAALCEETTDVDDIRAAMLLDVTAPSGQYANPDDMQDIYSIFYQKNVTTLPAYKRDTVTYLNEAGNPDMVYDELSNTNINPKNLRPEQFSAKFNDSWAKSLLKFHPEYCKLQEYERHKASYAWDRAFEATDTYAEAKLKGYLNPTANPGYFFPTGTAGQDPLSLESYALKDLLEGWLTNYNKQSGGNILSMWSVATATVKCSGAGNTCVTLYNTPAKAFSETTLCEGDRDMAWRNFRQLYLTAKRNVISGLISNVRCAGQVPPTAAQIIAAGDQPHFNNAIDALNQNGLGYLNNTANPNAAKDSANAALMRSYEANCSAYVKMWVKQLAPCQYNQTALDEIIPKLVAICKEGSDVDHPNGASSVKPSSTNAYRSFQQVLDLYNSQHGITDQLNCNAQLITAPKAYDRQPAYSNKLSYTKPDDCECRKLKTLQLEYQSNKKSTDANFSAYLLRTRKVTIAQTDLNQLLDACTITVNACSYFPRPVQIPVIMQCNVAPPCIPCIVADSLYTRFTISYPGITPTKTDEDSLQQKRNELFANYMNNRTGFSKLASEYLAFRDSCQLSSSRDTTVCEPTLQLTRSYNNNNGTDVIYDVISTGGNDCPTCRSNNSTLGVGVSHDGYLMAGSTTGSGNGASDAYLIKTDVSGNLLWAKTYGGAAADYFSKVISTVDGGYIAIGTTSSFGHPGGDVLVVKTDVTGNTEWTKTFGYATAGGEHGVDILPMSNGGYAFAGRYDFRPGESDWIVGTMDTQGAINWVKRFGSTSSDDGINMVEDNDSLVVAALSNIGTSLYDGVVFKVNKNTGTLISSKKYDIGQANWFGKILNTPTGYKIAFLNTSDYSGSNGIAGVLDLNKRGEVMSVSTLSRPGGKMVTGAPISLTNDGGYIMAVNANATTGGGDIHLQKLDASNSVSWSRHINLQGSEMLFKIIQNGDGSYAGTGSYNGHALLLQASPLGLAGCGDNDIPLTLTPATILSLNPNFGLKDLLLSNTTTTRSWTAQPAYPVILQLPCIGKDSCYTLSNGPLLCGNAEPLFPQITMEEVNNCSDSAFFAVSTGTELYKAYRDSIKNSFDQDYINACLKAGEQEIFTLTYRTSEYHYTLYYYDQAGNLVKTVPPSGVAVNRTPVWLSAVRAARAVGQELPQVHSMITQYRYNTLNQVIAQMTPDAGTKKLWYDRLGRVAISQNSKQQTDNAYTYTLYDDLGRVSEMGEMTSATPMSDEISRKKNVFDEWLNSASSTKTQITRTLYDAPYVPLTPVMNAGNLRNRISWTAIYNTSADLGSGNHSSATFYNYDIHGSVDTLVQDFKLGAMADASNRFKKIAYDYDVIDGKIKQVAFQPGEADAFYHRYSYDAENKLTSFETSRDNVHWENDAFYQYYKHGSLAKAVVGQQQVQGIDYAYTLHGWLKGVNSTVLTPDLDMGKDGIAGSIIAKDAFGFALHYFGSRDYNPINNFVKPFAEGADAGVNFKPLFNGNIAGMSVNLPSLGEPLLYSYGYDVLNRLVDMQALRNLNTVSNTWLPVTLPDFKENVSYDANGNILTYSRNGNNTFAGKPLAMDNMTYSYKPGKNQLDAIADAVPSANYGNDIDSQLSENYTYDATGNLIRDNAEGISSIEWTVYGKIKKITKTNGIIINYTYDASGNRISKNVNGQQTWYVRDGNSNVMSVYTSGDNSVNNGNLTQTETHLYGSSRLGMSTYYTNVQNPIPPESTNLPGLGTGININFILGRKFFELSNHTGNVLVTVSDRKRAISVNGTTVDHYEAEISSAQDYYPFGMLMPGRNGHQVEGGFATGNTMVNGHSVPEELSLINRQGNQPDKYVASQNIIFKEGFISGMNDVFNATIADGNYTGGGTGGTGGTSAVMSGYRYGYNGMEKDSEIKGEGNSYTTEYRPLDPRIGRWLSVDPKLHVGESVYAGMGNNPIAYNDLRGDSIPVRFYGPANGDGPLRHKIPSKVQSMFNNEYGIKVGYNKETQMLFYEGDFETTNVVSKTAREKVMADLTATSTGYTAENNIGTLYFGYTGMRTAVGFEVEQGMADINRGKRKGNAYINLDDFNEDLTAAGWDYSNLDRFGVSKRVFNMARVFEHEWFGHLKDGAKDPGRVSKMSKADKWPNLFRTEMNMPIRLTYTIRSKSGNSTYLIFGNATDNREKMLKIFYETEGNGLPTIFKSILKKN